MFPFSSSLAQALTPRSQQNCLKSASVVIANRNWVNLHRQRARIAKLRVSAQYLFRSLRFFEVPNGESVRTVI
jgi:hypothetical protein